MGRIEAIETYYKGYRFRSRLEARWAVGFDAFNWNWQYEYEGYEINGIWYLPDFVLHGVNIIDFQHPCHNQLNVDVWIEVKGAMTNEAREKAKAAQDNGINVLIVGDIPDGKNDQEILKNYRKLSHWGGPYILYNRQCVCMGTSKEREDCEHLYKEKEAYPYYKDAYETLTTFGICPGSQCEMPRYLWVGRNGEPIIGVWHTHTNRTDGDPANTLEMFKQARQARFEHGQNGYIGG